MGDVVKLFHASADIWNAPLIFLPFVVVVVISGFGVMAFLLIRRRRGD